MEPAGPEFLMEPLGSRAPGPEPGAAEEAPRPESPPRSSGPAGGDRVLPALPRSLGMGQGAFRHPGGSEPQNPAAESPRDRETPGPEPGARAPVELKVDVRVTPVGAAGGRTPSPAPSTRFLTVPVPESPVCARRAALPLLSPGATWSPLAVPGAGEGAGSADGTPASPPGCCRCRELGLDRKEGAALLSHAEGTRLPRAIELIGQKLERGLTRFRRATFLSGSSWGDSISLPAQLLEATAFLGSRPAPFLHLQSQQGLPVYMRSLRWALAIMAFFLAVSTVTMVALASRAGARCRQCPQGWMWAEEQCFYLSTEAQAWEASQAFCSAHHATLPLLSHTQGFLSKHHVAPRSWVGALRGPQGWYWTNGTPLPPQLLPKEDKDHPELSCGGLEEGRLVALNCTVPRPWVCARAPQ
ncbi:killer cell lectin-like receptor subfamily G member 2 isoform 1-T1 [Dugong dugon]